MEKCSARHFTITICTLQLIAVVECQVFDFMGFMYGPILANFFHIIFIIHGFFGTLQLSTKYILSYTLWNFFWMGWTIFVICFYLDIGILDKNSDILNLGTGSRSWWEVHGYGCIPDFTSINGSSLEQDPDLSRPPKPTKVEGCLMEYQYIEVVQAGMQCLLSVLAIICGVYMSKIYVEEDDSCENKNSQTINVPPSYYTYNSARGHLDQYQQGRANGYGPRPTSPRPMTPRRVKRRSVLARDTMNRNSLTRRRQGSSRSRSSQKRARAHQNPVTKLLEQQNRFFDSSLLSSSLNDSVPANSTNQSASDITYDFRGTNRLKSGLNNPIFQQSSNSSINQSGADEIYRPNSARSSYSNYHASRPVSYLHNNEYFSNQAGAQLPVGTNKNKTTGRVVENHNNMFQLPSTTTPSTFKSFSQKNFNFLGINVKNNGINNNVNSNNNNNNSIEGSSNCNLNNLGYLPRYDGTIRNSKKFRVDLTRTTDNVQNSFFSQGPPAYREGGLDSETVI